jgi:hypothetical protein
VDFLAAGGVGLAGAFGSAGVWACSEAAKRSADRMAAARAMEAPGFRSTAIVSSLRGCCLFCLTLLTAGLL